MPRGPFPGLHLLCAHPSPSIPDNPECPLGANSSLVENYSPRGEKENKVIIITFYCFGVFFFLFLEKSGETLYWGDLAKLTVQGDR